MTPSNSTTTTLEITSPSRSALVASFSLYVLPLVVGIAGNAGIVHIIVSHKSLRTGANAYIANMAALDLLACTLLVPLRMAFYVAQSTMDREGFTLCEADVFFHSVVDAGRMLFLGAISFERYQAVANPFQRDKAAAARRAFITLAILWVVMILYAVVVTIFFYDTIMFEFCMRQSSGSAPWNHRLWGGIEIYFVLPLSLLTVLVVIVCYGLMFRILHTHRNKMLRHSVASSNKVAPAPSSVLPAKSHLDPPDAASQTLPAGICVTNATTDSATLANDPGVVESRGRYEACGSAKSTTSVPGQDTRLKEDAEGKGSCSVDTDRREAVRPKSLAHHPESPTSTGPHISGIASPGPPLASHLSSAPCLARTTSPGPRLALSASPDTRLASSTSSGPHGAKVCDVVTEQDAVLQTSSPTSSRHCPRSAARQSDAISFIRPLPIMPSLINENSLPSPPPATAKGRGHSNSQQKCEDSIDNVIDLSAGHYQQSSIVSSERINTEGLSNTSTINSNAEHDSNAICGESVKHPDFSAKNDTVISEDSFPRAGAPHQGLLSSDTSSPMRTVLTNTGSILSLPMATLNSCSSSSADQGGRLASLVVDESIGHVGENSAPVSEVGHRVTNTSEHNRQKRVVSAVPSARATKVTAPPNNKDGKTRSAHAVGFCPNSDLGKARRKTGRVWSFYNDPQRSAEDALGVVDSDLPARAGGRAKGPQSRSSKTFCLDSLPEQSEATAETQPSGSSNRVFSESGGSKNVRIVQTVADRASLGAATSDTTDKTTQAAEPDSEATSKAKGNGPATASPESPETSADPQTASVTNLAKEGRSHNNDGLKDVEPSTNDDSLKDVHPRKNEDSTTTAKAVGSDGLTHGADPQNANGKGNEYPKAVDHHNKKDSMKTVRVVEMDGTAHVEKVADAGNIQGAVCMFNPRNRVHGRRRVEVKVAKRLVIIFLTFLLLWLPYPFSVLVLRVMHMQPQEEEAAPWPAGVQQTVTDVTAVLSALTTVTAAVNPVFYGLATVNIRSIILAKLKGACRCKCRTL